MVIRINKLLFPNFYNLQKGQNQHSHSMQFTTSLFASLSKADISSTEWAWLRRCAVDVSDNILTMLVISYIDVLIALQWKSMHKFQEPQQYKYDTVGKGIMTETGDLFPCLRPFLNYLEIIIIESS